MSALSDVSILKSIGNGKITVSPFEPKLIQPASLEIRLGEYFKRGIRCNNDFHAGCDVWSPPSPPIDPFDPPATIWSEDLYIPVGGQIIIQPGEAILACSLEKIGISHELSAKVCGKSSNGRLFLAVHITAGFIDPGFCGIITLELFNFNRRAIILRPGQSIAQLCFDWLDVPAEKPYGHAELKSRYQNQERATESRYSR